jgi:hypothetical protein
MTAPVPITETHTHRVRSGLFCRARMIVRRCGLPRRSEAAEETDGRLLDFNADEMKR